MTSHSTAMPALASCRRVVPFLHFAFPRSMQIDLVFPVLPPTLDGIGDHTAYLAEALAGQGCDVRILTAQRDWTPLSGVEIRQTFDTENRRGILSLVEELRDDSPDWLMLQFEQTSYGRWGLNPFLPFAIYRLRQVAPDTKIAVMFHEDFMPASDIKFAIMSTWQRVQFWLLGHLADTAFFSTEPWADKYRRWFPRTQVHHLPVGSNIPKVGGDDLQKRECPVEDPDMFVFGLFGQAHPSRLSSYINEAVGACMNDLPQSQVLYVGPDGDTVREALDNNIPLQDAGPLPAADVSRCFSTMDLYLAPFENGVSTRRGSFLTGLQHGLPTISTKGPDTGTLLRQHDGRAFTLVPWTDREQFVSRVVSCARDREQRQHLSRRAQSFYRAHFDWPKIAESLLRHLARPGTRSAASFS